MTSKERVKRAFDFQTTDKTPLNYLANSGIDKKLKDYFGLDISDNEGLLQKLGIDFRNVYLNYTGERLHLERENRVVDPCFGIIMKWIDHGTGTYCDFCDFPLAEADYDTVKRWKMPSPDDFDYLSIISQIESVKDYYICYTCMPDIINATGMIMGMENVLVGLATDDSAVLTYIDRKLEIQLEQLRRILEMKIIDCLWSGEDLGTQNSPLISMPLFRKHIRPRHQPFIDLAKKYNVKVMMHSCGSSSWAYEDFIEMGIDIVDTLQVEATDMSPEYLKKKFGKRLAFHGFVSTATLLTNGTPDEVKEYCHFLKELFAPDFGLAISPTHMIQDNTPLENVLAMYDI